MIPENSDRAENKYWYCDDDCSDYDGSNDQVFFDGIDDATALIFEKIG